MARVEGALNKVVATAAIAALVCLVLPGTGCAAAANVTKPTVLKWHRELTVLSMLRTDDDLWVQSTSHEDVLIDGTTDRRTTLSVPANCAAALGTAQRFLWRCRSQTDSEQLTGLIYDPGTRTWDTSPQFGCASNVDTGCFPVAFGSEWIEWDTPDCPGATHCGDQLSWQSISTGATALPSQDFGQGLWDNPNTAGLISHLCSPLALPEDSSNIYSVQAGDITFYGKFAVLQQSGYGDLPTESLQKCGSSLRERVGAFTPAGIPTGTSKLLVWQKSDRSIAYLELPSLRAGTWTLPSSLDTAITQLAVSGDRVYVKDGDMLFSAELPSSAR